jgi:hypothetical protein
LKAVAHSLALGCEKVFLFSWNYDTSSIGYRPDVQTECRVAAENLDGASFARKLELGDKNLTAYLFRRHDGEHLLTVWTEVKGLTARLRLTSRQPVTVINHKGEKSILQPQNGQVSLVADFCPKVVRGLQEGVQVKRFE